MYLQKLKLENYGPIEYADINCSFCKNGSPKPIIFDYWSDLKLNNNIIKVRVQIDKDKEIKLGSLKIIKKDI